MIRIFKKIKEIFGRVRDYEIKCGRNEIRIEVYVKE